jgi:endonuclease/exonuclease/phosphatase (EEP) superfamily protein YafD
MAPTPHGSSCDAASPSASDTIDSILMVIGIAALAVAAIALIARYLPGVILPVVVTAALAPYLMLAAPVAMIDFIVLRDWPLVTFAGVLTVATATVQLRWHIGTMADGGLTVRVVSANLRYGRADAAAVAELAAQHADILAVQELTPEFAQQISAGVDVDFPYHALRAREGPAGVGIWSRYPLQRDQEFDEFWLGLITARVQIPDVTGEVNVIAAHMSAPGHTPLNSWRDDLARLGATLQDIAASAGGPVMLVADLNATPDNLDFRRLLHGGYDDAARQAGAGLTRTYPSDVRYLPPVFAVDHILTHGCVATSVRTISVRGSDHRALAANIRMPGR